MHTKQSSALLKGVTPIGLLKGIALTGGGYGVGDYLGNRRGLTEGTRRGLVQGTTSGMTGSVNDISLGLTHFLQQLAQKGRSMGQGAGGGLMDPRDLSLEELKNLIKQRADIQKNVTRTRAAAAPVPVPKPAPAPSIEKKSSLNPKTSTNMYHKALFEKVAAAIDFNQMAPDQTSAFRQGTASNFNSKSWLDRNKMYRKMQGEADWADNTKARAMGSNFQYNLNAPAAPRTTPKALPPVASPYKNPRPGNIRDQSVMQALNPVHQIATMTGASPTYTQAMHNQPIKPGLSASQYKAQQRAFANELPKSQTLQNVRQLVEMGGAGPIAARVPFLGNALYPGADGK
jgi:hypothetical protein